jgi:DNA-binding transcriptional LysR family regulator
VLAKYKLMEETLGLKLFHRLSKGVELTEEGRALLTYVEHSFSLLDAAQKHLHDLKQLADGEIRIGASDSLIKHLLLTQLKLFYREYPGIRIRLSHGRTPDITQRLKEGQIDCAIVHMPINLAVGYPDTCDIRGFLRSWATYQDLENRSLPTSHLAKLPLPLLSPGSSSRLFVEQWFSARGFTVKPDIELGNIDPLVEFARLGYGAHYPLLREGGAPKR